MQQWPQTKSICITDKRNTFVTLIKSQNATRLTSIELTRTEYCTGVNNCGQVKQSITSGSGFNEHERCEGVSLLLANEQLDDGEGKLKGRPRGSTCHQLPIDHHSVLTVGEASVVELLVHQGMGGDALALANTVSLQRKRTCTNAGYVAVSLHLLLQ